MHTIYFCFSKNLTTFSKDFQFVCDMGPVTRTRSQTAMYPIDGGTISDWKIETNVAKPFKLKLRRSPSICLLPILKDKQPELQVEHLEKPLKKLRLRKQACPSPIWSTQIRDEKLVFKQEKEEYRIITTSSDESLASQLPLKEDAKSFPSSVPQEESLNSLPASQEKDAQSVPAPVLQEEGTKSIPAPQESFLSPLRQEEDAKSYNASQEKDAEPIPSSPVRQEEDVNTRGEQVRPKRKAEFTLEQRLRDPIFKKKFVIFKKQCNLYKKLIFATGLKKTLEDFDVVWAGYKIPKIIGPSSAKIKGPMKIYVEDSYKLDFKRWGSVWQEIELTKKGYEEPEPPPFRPHTADPVTAKLWRQLVSRKNFEAYVSKKIAEEDGVVAGVTAKPVEDEFEGPASPTPTLFAKNVDAEDFGCEVDVDHNKGAIFPAKSPPTVQLEEDDVVEEEEDLTGRYICTPSDEDVLVITVHEDDFLPMPPIYWPWP